MGNADLTRRLGLVAVAVGLAAGIALAGRRLARREHGPRQERFRCACGATYRVRGADRHRVYWREGADQTEAVLGDRCPRCDAPLPSGHDMATV